MSSSGSVAVRAVLAVGLMIGFYVLAIAIAAVLIALPIASAVYRGGIGAGNILEWSGGKTTLVWPANPNAALYRLYRGAKADLPRLVDGANDSCTRYAGTAATATELNEVPAAGDLHWFVVVSVNGGGGEGTAGFGTSGPRIVNSTGVCP